MPFNIGPLELIAVLVLALLVLGPGKLPEVGAALGKSIREFRKAATDVQDATRVDAASSSAPSTASGTGAPGAGPTTAAAPAAQAASPTGALAAPPEGGAASPNTLSQQAPPNEIGGERPA